MECRLLHIC